MFNLGRPGFIKKIIESHDQGKIIVRLLPWQQECRLIDRFFDNGTDVFSRKQNDSHHSK